MIHVPFFAELIHVTLEGGPFPMLARAVPLLLGTSAVESAFTHTQQLSGGPARGLFQCEPATEADVWQNFLAYQPALRDWFLTRCGMTGPNVEALEHNMVYGVLMARTHYYRCDPEPLPQARDIEEQAARWKLYYNSPLGAGTEADYVARYAALVQPVWPRRGRA